MIIMVGFSFFSLDNQVDFPQDSTINEDCTSAAQPPDTELNQAVLSILGYELSPAKNLTPPFQKEVAISCTNVLQKGIIDDDRLSLINKYPSPENCPLLKAPQVNPEVLSVTREVVARRDGKISDLQNQIGAALTALGRAITSLLKDVDNEKNISLIQLLSDASRLLLDFHQKQSKTRRELISLDLKKEVRETLSNAQVDGWLFGEKLGDRLKGSKEMERSGLELKATKPRIFKKNSAASSTNQNLNFRRPPRPQGEYQGGRKLHTQNPNPSRRPTLPTKSRKEEDEEGNAAKQDPQGETLLTKNQVGSLITAGRLKSYYDNWTKLTNDKSVLSYISGFKIPFLSSPVQKCVPREPTWSKKESNILADCVSKLLSSGAISIVQPCKRQFISNIFAVAKPDGSFRLVINLKFLNQFVRTEHFKLEDQKNGGAHSSIRCLFSNIRPKR